MKISSDLHRSHGVSDRRLGGGGGKLPTCPPVATPLISPPWDPGCNNWLNNTTWYVDKADAELDFVNVSWNWVNTYLKKKLFRLSALQSPISSSLIARGGATAFRQWGQHFLFISFTANSPNFSGAITFCPHSLISVGASCPHCPTVAPPMVIAADYMHCQCPNLHLRSFHSADASISPINNFIAPNIKSPDSSRFPLYAPQCPQTPMLCPSVRQTLPTRLPVCQ